MRHRVSSSKTELVRRQAKVEILKVAFIQIQIIKMGIKGKSCSAEAHDSKS